MCKGMLDVSEVHSRGRFPPKLDSGQLTNDAIDSLVNSFQLITEFTVENHTKLTRDYNK